LLPTPQCIRKRVCKTYLWAADSRLFNLLSIPLLFFPLSNGISRVHWIRLYIAHSDYCIVIAHFPLSSFSDVEFSTTTALKVP